MSSRATAIGDCYAGGLSRKSRVADKREDLTLHGSVGLALPMFDEILQRVVDGAAGTQAALIMGSDGIAVQSYSSPNAAASGPAAVDIESVGMEYSVLLKDILRATQMLKLGTASDMMVRASGLTAIVRWINDEYFAVVTVAPGGNSGKARYLLRLQHQELRRALS